MAETKRVSDQYNIEAPSIVLNGNLTVLGSSTTVESVNSNIVDNFVTLNSGEHGAGVSTLGTTSGITIDRGSLPNVGLRWNETNGHWEFTTDGSIWGQILTSTSLTPGSDTQVIFNQGGSSGANAHLTFDYTNFVLDVDNISIGGSQNTITTISTNSNLKLSANGTGQIHVMTALALDTLGSSPTNLAGTVGVYSNSAGNGNTGVFFVNSSTRDELISKTRAVALALVL